MAARDRSAGRSLFGVAPRLPAGLGPVLRAALVGGLALVVMVAGLPPLPVAPAAAAVASPPGAVNPDPVVVAVTTPGPTPVSGDISTDAVWSAQGSPYVLSGQVRVMDGVSLTLLPGTVVKFATGTNGRLVVFGQLLSLGTPTERVVFTSGADDSAGGDSNGDGSASAPARGDWDYVSVRGAYDPQQVTNRDLSVFDYTDMRFGGNGSGSSCVYAELSVASIYARVVVSNSSFTESEQAGISIVSGQNPNGFVGIYDSHFATSMCGIQTSGVGEVMGNTFEDSFTKYAFWALGAKKVRVQHGPRQVRCKRLTGPYPRTGRRPLQPAHRRAGHLWGSFAAADRVLGELLGRRPEHPGPAGVPDDRGDQRLSAAAGVHL
jgi:hypothetical protein